MAFTVRWVRADAAGSGDGTTNSNSGATGAFTFSEFVTDYNDAGGRAGYHYKIVSGFGTYSRTTTTDTFTGDGTTTSPIVVEGVDYLGNSLAGNGWSGGALVTTGFPEITYTTGKISGSSATYCIWRCLNVTSAVSGATIQLGTRSMVSNCKVGNTGTSSSSYAVNLSSGAYSLVRNCDITNNESGPLGAIATAHSTQVLIGNRIRAANCAAIYSTTGTFIGNTMYGSVNGLKHISTNAPINIINNTIANNSGDGIQFAAATTGEQTIMNNHITGNGGYGINFQSSTCVKQLGFNRFRDNSSGPIDMSTGDWVLGSSVNNITSDDTDADDYVDAAGGNYALLNTAAAITSGIGWRNVIGAHGASSFGGGGVAIINRRSNTLTLR